MKREITETLTVTRTEYVCDLCGETLVPGKKPIPCFVCGHDTCSKLECRQYRDFPGLRDQPVCSRCLNLWDTYCPTIANIHDQAVAQADVCLAQWRRQSLGEAKDENKAVVSYALVGVLGED